jgi:hypothetical protein
MRRRLALLLAMLPLSGCWWVGLPFYAPDPAARAVFRAGRYSYATKDERGTARLSWDAAGHLVFTRDGKADDAMPFTLARLPGTPDIWITEIDAKNPDDGDTGPGGAIYGLMQRRGDEVRGALILDCDPAAAVVRAAGGTVEGNDGNSDAKDGHLTCTFNDRATLERALRAWVAADPAILDEVTMRRTGD